LSGWLRGPILIDQREIPGRAAGQGLSDQTQPRRGSDGMSKAAVRELSALLRAAVTRGGGNGSAVTTDEFAAQLSTRVWLFVGATPELIERGRAVRQRDQQQVKWARGLVRGIYQHAQTADRVARGLLDLLDHEIRTYQEEREARRR